MTEVETEPAAPVVGPTLRLLKVLLATRSDIPTPEDQRDFCGSQRPGAVNFRLSFGSDDWSTDPVVDLRRYADEAEAPLVAVREDFFGGELQTKAEALGRREAEATAAMAAAKVKAAEALETAARELAAGRDPKKAETAYRTHCQDEAVYANRARVLRGLHVDAQGEADRALAEAIEAKRQRLYEAAMECEQDLNRALCEAVAPLLIPLMKAKAARMRLGDRAAALAGDVHRPRFAAIGAAALNHAQAVEPDPEPAAAAAAEE